MTAPASTIIVRASLDLFVALWAVVCAAARERRTQLMSLCQHRHNRCPRHARPSFHRQHPSPQSRILSEHQQRAPPVLQRPPTGGAAVGVACPARRACHRGTHRRACSRQSGRAAAA
eukprot:4661445-Prymnesium_polylepis.2